MDPITMALMGGTALSSLVGGIFGKKSAKKAARAQAAAAAQARADMLAGQQHASDLLSPAANYKPSLMRLHDLLGLNGGQSQQDAYGAFRDTPGYQFALQQGQEGLNRTAAAHGGAMSGRTIADSIKFNQGMADQNFGQYYGRLNDMFGTQLGAAENLAGVYSNTGNNLAGIAMQNGNNMAASKIAQGNAWTNALQNISNTAGTFAGNMSASSYGNRPLY